MSDTLTRAKSLCVANIKGGVGKTTLAINTAWVFANDLKKRVLVVDMDPQLNATTALLAYDKAQEFRQSMYSVYNFFDNGPESGIHGLRGGRSTIAPREVRPVKVPKKGFDLILGSLDIAFLGLHSDGRSEGLKLTALQNGLNEIGAYDNYDLIIIDTPPTPSDYLIASLVAANYFLIPTKPDALSVQGLGLFYRLYDQLVSNHGFRKFVKAQPLGVVVTLAQNDAQFQEGTKRICDIPRTLEESGIQPEHPQFFKPVDEYMKYRAAVSHAQDEQRLVFELSGYKCGDSKERLRRICREISKRLSTP